MPGTSAYGQSSGGSPVLPVDSSVSVDGPEEEMLVIASVLSASVSVLGPCVESAELAVVPDPEADSVSPGGGSSGQPVSVAVASTRPSSPAGCGPPGCRGTRGRNDARWIRVMVGLVENGRDATTLRLRSGRPARDQPPRADTRDHYATRNDTHHEPAWTTARCAPTRARRRATTTKRRPRGRR